MADRDDARLTAEVLAALERDVFLDPLTMQVVVDNGIVTLTGSIDSEINRKAAEDAARRVVGIKGIVNELTLMAVESSSRADEDITNEVCEQMAADPTINLERFHVRSHFGRVFITGTAESLEEKESLVAAAKRVPGVEDIEDRTDLVVPAIGGQTSAE